jgi:hypothetical protein
VRRSRCGIYDRIVTDDMITDDTSLSAASICGTASDRINLDAAEFMVKVPRALEEVGGLLEPLTAVEKGLLRRTRSSGPPGLMPVPGRRHWAGIIGLLATLGLQVDERRRGFVLVANGPVHLGYFREAG